MSAAPTTGLASTGVMPDWTFVIAYYNEADFIGATLESLAAQTRRPGRLVLVDNGSNDAGPDIARQIAATMTDVETIHLFEDEPGKIFALETAAAHITTNFVAFGDADTFYPADYLATAAGAFAKGGEDVVAVMATDVTAPGDGPEALRRRRHNQRVSRLWPRQTHTGGYGQCFRTQVFVAAGGYSHFHWPFVLMDHEIMQRMVKRGRAIYPYDLWCIPSQRRSDRTRVRWTLAERLLYHFSPWSVRDWYFYHFLAHRLRRRNLRHINLREKSWLVKN